MLTDYSLERAGRLKKSNSTSTSNTYSTSTPTSSEQSDSNNRQRLLKDGGDSATTAGIKYIYILYFNYIYT